MNARVVEVHRRPQAGAYREVTRVDEAGAVIPLAFPDVAFVVKDFLPTA